MQKYLSIVLVILIICCTITGCKNNLNNTSSLSDLKTSYEINTKDFSSNDKYKTDTSNNNSSDQQNQSKPIIKNNKTNSTGVSSNGNVTNEKSNIVVENIPVTENIDNNKEKIIESAEVNTELKTVSTNHIELPEENYYQYSTLTDDEKDIYNIILYSIKKTRNVVNITTYSISYNSSLKILQKVIADYPQFFWLSKYTSILYNENNQKAYYIFLYYTDGVTTDKMNSDYQLTEIADRSSISNQIDSLNKKINYILNTIPDNLSNIEKEKLIHDYIIKAIVYDKYNASRTYTYADTLPHCFDLYGAVCEGIAVCEGYSKMFQYLCYCVGINSTQITGQISGGNHMWNAVQIENKWYHLDTTWDDGLSDDTPYYEYFNFTTKKALEERDIDTSVLNAPNCTSEENSFINAFSVIVSNLYAEPENYKKSADELNVIGEYLIVYLNNVPYSKVYFNTFFLNNASCYNKYISLKNYNFKLTDNYKKYGNYIYILIKR